MSPKRMGTSEEEQQHYCYSDPLNSLPHELLHLILSKITDPKTLIVSSLVSKRIASILSHSQSLSLKFHFSPALEHYGNVGLRVTSLLRMFNCVRSLRVELPCSCRYSEGKEVFKWKAKTGIRCGMLSLLFSSEPVSKIDGIKVRGEEEEEEGEGKEQDLVTPSTKDMMGPYFYATKMYGLMQLLVSRHPNLDSVELMDAKRHGKLSIGGEALIKMRTTMLDSTIETLNFIGDRMLLLWPWYVHKLLLPLTGSVMKKVMLVVIGGEGVADENGDFGAGEEVEDNGDFLDGGFVDDEDGIFSEAMTQILSKHDKVL